MATLPCAVLLSKGVAGGWLVWSKELGGLCTIMSCVYHVIFALTTVKKSLYYVTMC